MASFMSCVMRSLSDIGVYRAREMLVRGEERF
jgi:hypothetical protein